MPESTEYPAYPHPPFLASPSSSSSLPNLSLASSGTMVLPSLSFDTTASSDHCCCKEPLHPSYSPKYTQSSQDWPAISQNLEARNRSLRTELKVLQLALEEKQNECRIQQSEYRLLSLKYKHLEFKTHILARKLTTVPPSISNSSVESLPTARPAPWLASRPSQVELRSSPLSHGHESMAEPTVVRMVY
ncbi:hypothetical protein H4R34_003995 [Dimargaris verticillata]|uniref:Uncharacterized protein n=1 Tax=Dimargaris verticillata TaxID=2761393 RepID=A0A9W8AZ10_9FUNG|nr:hypothetical protein H4R34_003995 [Dimargaris verticillata]